MSCYISSDRCAVFTQSLKACSQFTDSIMSVCSPAYSAIVQQIPFEHKSENKVARHILCVLHNDDKRNRDSMIKLCCFLFLG